jgi:hypothetical protein
MTKAGWFNAMSGLWCGALAVVVYVREGAPYMLFVAIFCGVVFALAMQGLGSDSK